MRYVLISLVLLGCADWPEDAGAPPLGQTGDWPSLVPVQDLFADLPEARETEADRLAARAAALRYRAALLRRSARTIEEMEALRARLAR